MNEVARQMNQSRQSCFLLGPLGTGKTFWTQHCFPEALRFNLLEGDLYRDLSAAPEMLISMVEGAQTKDTIVIDEVQKVPELMDAVHFLIDKYPTKRFVLTGSNIRGLRRRGITPKGGRLVKYQTHPYTVHELKDSFKLDRALKYGMVPMIYNAENPSEKLGGYVSLYLKEEVKMEGLVRDVHGFNRFLQCLSMMQGKPLNLASVATEARVARKTAEGYIGILEDLFLSYRVPMFIKDEKRQLRRHPKFFYFDLGVFRSLRPKGPLDRPDEEEVMALHSLVAQNLRAWCDYSQGNHEIFYWQTRSGVGIDLIIYGKSGIWGFNIRNTSKVSLKDLSSLKKFNQDYPEAHCFLLNRGRYMQLFKKEGVIALPVEMFLQQLAPNSIWDS